MNEEGVCCDSCPRTCPDGQCLTNVDGCYKCGECGDDDDDDDDDCEMKEPCDWDDDCCGNTCVNGKCCPTTTFIGTEEDCEKDGLCYDYNDGCPVCEPCDTETTETTDTTSTDTSSTEPTDRPDGCNPPCDKTKCEICKADVCVSKCDIDDCEECVNGECVDKTKEIQTGLCCDEGEKDCCPLTETCECIPDSSCDTEIDLCVEKPKYKDCKECDPSTGEYTIDIVCSECEECKTIADGGTGKCEKFEPENADEIRNTLWWELSEELEKKGCKYDDRVRTGKKVNLGR